ncbi:MAG: OmpA family protein [Chitinophagales bacterium]
MKKTIVILGSVVWAVSAMAGSCWQKGYECGNKLMAQKHFLRASEVFKSALTHAPADSLWSVQARLAECYNRMGNTIAAETWYSRIAENPKTNAAHRLAYGRVLQANGKYEEAMAQFKKVPTPLADSLAMICLQVINDHFENSQYQISSLAVNTAAAEYAAVPYKKGVVFTSDRFTQGERKRLAWNGLPFTDLYYTEGEANCSPPAVTKFSPSLSSCLNEGTATFSPGGETIVYSRNNLKKCKYRDHLQLVTSSLENGLWSEPQPLAFDPAYSFTHPSISLDGQWLYFASDMPGGYGGMDLYRSHNESGFWGAPANLGKEVNTTGNELFPFFDGKGTLYFSSNGHAGMGGLDVFSAMLQDGKFKQVENLKSPVNSSKDDFAFIMNEKSGKGFLSSNRNSDDDLFQVINTTKKVKKEIPVIGHDNRAVVVDKATGKPIPNAKVEVYSGTERNGKFYLTDADGALIYSFAEGKDVALVAGAEGYDVTTFKGEKYGAAQAYPIELAMEKKSVEGKDLYAANVYYETNATDINANHLPLLKEASDKFAANSGCRIIINGYADERGDANYNYGLSVRRAKKIEQYLRDQGIPSSAIASNFYGAVPLQQDCRRNAKCMAQYNKENRRVEVKVVRF